MSSSYSIWIMDLNIYLIVILEETKNNHELFQNGVNQSHKIGNHGAGRKPYDGCVNMTFE